MNTSIEKRRVPIEQIKPAAYNPRKDLQPGDKEYEKIKRSILTFGYVDPIIWNESTGHIVGGHQRFKVLKAEGATEIDCVVLHVDDINDEKALNVALNRASGAWDIQRLADLLQDLMDAKYDTDETGFDAAEIDEVMSQVYTRKLKEDSFNINQEWSTKTYVKSGDLWQLGRHRLLIADPQEEETFTRLMDSRKANLLLADLCNGAWGCIPATSKIMAPGASAYVFHLDRNSLPMRTAFEDAGYHTSGICIWLKGNDAVGESLYAEQHEPVLFGWRQGENHRWLSDRKQTTLWDWKAKYPSDYPGKKPIMLVGYPIRNSSAANAVVVDPWCGYGATLVACEQLKRICMTVEPNYDIARVAIERYAAFIQGNGINAEITVKRKNKTMTLAEVKGEK